MTYLLTILTLLYLVLMHFTGQKKKLNVVTHTIYIEVGWSRNRVRVLGGWHSRIYGGVPEIIQSYEKVTVSFWILVFVFNLEYLCQFSIKHKNQGQFWNLLIMRILKLRYSRLKTMPKIQNDIVTFLCDCTVSLMSKSLYWRLRI